MANFKLCLRQKHYGQPRGDCPYDAFGNPCGGADAIRPLRKKFLPRSQTTSRPLLEGGARRAGVGIKRQAYACAYDGLAPMLMGDQGRRLRQAPLAINNCFPTVSQPFLNCFPIICHLIFARFAIALLSLCYCFAATSKFVSSTI